ncbi:polyphenol oxidase family protein [bacterium]|nr:polyphenol oxidase family protein [bacterium]
MSQHEDFFSSHHYRTVLSKTYPMPVPKVVFGGKESSSRSVLSQMGVRSVGVLTQVHGAELLCIEAGEIAERIFRHNAEPREAEPSGGIFETEKKYDGWFLNIRALQREHRLRGVAFGIKTADCLPVLLIGDTHIALLHAGWRGLEKGILHRAEEHFSAQHDTIRHVTLGPAADPAEYEVGEEFRTHFPNSGAVTAVSNNKHLFNIYTEATHQLRLLNYHGPIEIPLQHTITSPHLHSHRKARTPNRNLTLLQLT